MRDVMDALSRMSTDELRVLCRDLRIPGCSKLRKSDLVNQIASIDESRLRKHLFPTWWHIYHNHVYGAVTLVSFIATIVIFFWPSSTNNDVPNQIDRTYTFETPIRFADYALLTPTEKETLFNNRKGEQFVWQGFLSDTIGFELGSIAGIPYETPVGIEVTPTQLPVPQLKAEIQFGEIEPTDSGIALAIDLNRLNIGQRVRLSGELAGGAESPILKDAVLEAIYPIGE